MQESSTIDKWQGRCGKCFSVHIAAAVAAVAAVAVAAAVVAAVGICTHMWANWMEDETRHFLQLGTISFRMHTR